MKSWVKAQLCLAFDSQELIFVFFFETFFFEIYFIFILPALLSVYHVYATLLEAIRSPGTGGTDGCVLTCDYWKLNLSALEEQQVCLAAGPSLQL